MHTLMGALVISFALALNPASSTLSFATQHYSDLPEIGHSSGGILSQYQEKMLGQAFMEKVNQYLPLLDDLVIVDYLESLGMRLVRASDAPTKPFHFFVIDSSSINAFAGPGGNIGVNTGLMIDAQSEGELAAVMAHEIAHVTRHHISRGMDASKRVQLSTIAAVLAAIAIGTQNSGMGAGALTATLAGAQAQMFKYSRSYEREADQEGIYILEKAGIDPKNLVYFFERLHRQNQLKSETLPEYLSTHPLNEERISQLRNRTFQSSRVYSDNNDTFDLIKARIHVETANSIEAIIDYYEEQTQNQKNNIDHFIANQYGLSLALLRNQQFEQSENIVNKLIKHQPNEFLFQLLKSQILFESGKKDAALSLYAELADFYPENHIIAQITARTLLHAGEPKTAYKLLMRFRRAYPQKNLSLELVSQIQYEAGFPMQATLTHATWLADLGRKQLAINQLNTALNQLEDEDSIIKSQLQARLDEIEDKEK